MTPKQKRILRLLMLGAILVWSVVMVFILIEWQRSGEQAAQTIQRCSIE